MSNSLFRIDKNGNINIRKYTTIQNGTEIYTVFNKLLDGNYIYLYMNENNFYMTNNPINRVPNGNIWTKDLAVIPVDQNSDNMNINIGKFLIALSLKDQEGNPIYRFNSAEGFFHLYFKPKRYELCKPFRMEANGELLKYPSFLDTDSENIYYGRYNIDDNTSINLPYIVSSEKNNEQNSKSGLQLDVQMFNDMLNIPLEEGEILYLTAISEKTESGLYKHYLYPIFRTKDNIRKKKGVTRSR